MFYKIKQKEIYYLIVLNWKAIIFVLYVQLAPVCLLHNMRENKIVII